MILSSAECMFLVKAHTFATSKSRQAFVLFGYLFSVLTVFYAPLSLTASARYSVIIFGMIFGYLILGETPTYNMIIGAIIITLSGLFVIKREKEIGKIK